MNNIRLKTEIWNGHEIRFIEKEPNNWWAVPADVAIALSLRGNKLVQRLPDDVLSKYPIVDSIGRTQEIVIVNEYGIYDAIFSSRKPEAKEFKRWVYNVIKELRTSSGLEGFRIFRMLDKDHQKEAMHRLKEGLHKPVSVDFIKANTISNKATSSMYGHPIRC